MQTHTIFGATITLDTVSVEEMEIPVLGRTYVRYCATMPDGAEFTGAEFSPSPLISDPTGIAAALELLSYLCLKPGDTDEEYFADYTPAQIAWSTSYACEYMQSAVDEAIVLHDVYGWLGDIDGTDQNGAQWATFNEQDEERICKVCENLIEEREGWERDGDSEYSVCMGHVYAEDKADAEDNAMAWIGDPL